MKISIKHLHTNNMPIKNGKFVMPKTYSDEQLLVVFEKKKDSIKVKILNIW